MKKNVIMELGDDVVVKHIVTSYDNPDLDGTASMISLSSFLCKTKNICVEPVVFGGLNSETIFVLNTLEITHPTFISDSDSANLIYLVDTHHLSQIHKSLRPESVVMIYDHHPAGNPEAFTNATIINEKVGAVATIISELLKTNNISVEKNIYALLYAAIISNTLNFTAPTTTTRDRKVADWLITRTSIPSDFVRKMFEARSNYDCKTTEEILFSDYKEFDLINLKFGISQIEGYGIEKLVKRPDLKSKIKKIRLQKSVHHMFFNAVDINEGKTFLVTDQKETQKILSKVLHVEFVTGIAKINRILLRKSDLIPKLKVV